MILIKQSLKIMSFPCLNPNVAVNYYTKPDGTMTLKFMSNRDVDWNVEDLVKKFGSDNVFLLPCGKCEHCGRNFAEDWAIRCTLEASCHPFNYFITLTYDEQHIKYACIEDLRKFFDRLSGFKHKNTFKMFSCMEKGDLTNRLHFHVVLFSDFELDLIEPQWISGFYYYHSKKIGKLWKFGFHNVAPFESDCARYVAKYTNKGKSKIIHSRNLGFDYYQKHKIEIIKDNFRLYGNFGDRDSVVVPRCFVEWFVRDGDSEIIEFKNKRKALGKFMSAYSFRNLGSFHHGDDIRTLRNHVKTKKKGGI